jgi:hypothetical protein
MKLENMDEHEALGRHASFIIADERNAEGEPTILLFLSSLCHIFENAAQKLRSLRD